ncbi:MAG: hypothetical protein K2I06_05150 [Ruminococcus sp.]|nr:hypothetical protein [Ruminococcus sp.]
MKKINRIFSKLFTTVLSGTIFISGIPINAVSVSSDTGETIPEAEIISVVEGETSEYGLTSVYYVDEDGNIVEPNLIPERETRASVLPSKFDLRDYGYVTSVKNQGSTGSCWAHAAMAAAESNMIMNGLADNTIDLSESHLVWFTQGVASKDKNDPLYGDGESLGNTDTENGAYDHGGNSKNAMATLGRWSGVQLEKNAPSVTNRPIVDESLRYTSYGYLVNSDEIDASDRESIKQHLMNTGALACSYYDDDELNMSKTYKYYPYDAYYNNSTSKTNHAVTIVGWDDNYSRNNFKTNVPPGDGAWIIKNSWGGNKHIDGYFYLSYYDTSFSKITSFEIADKSTYDNIYQYDGAAPSSNFSYKSDTITAANIFTTECNETISAAAFYTKEASVPYIISVYADVEKGNPTSGTLLTTQKGTMSYAGYHVIDLNEPVAISKGTEFSVVVTLDKIHAGMAMQECINLSECSYYTWGTPTSKSKWVDTSKEDNLTACIKVLTRSDIQVNSSNFPDSNFRKYVSKFDTDSDGTLSYSEVVKVSEMDLSNLGISDFKGMEFFTELTKLNCSYNPVVSLDLSRNNLNNFICYGCSIKLGNVKCNGFTINGLDLGKVSDTQGMTIKDSFIIPDGKSMYYKYNCGKNYTIQMTITADSLTHSYGSWSDNGSSHIKNCFYCNNVILESHSFGSWNGKSEEHSHSCLICGAVKSEKHSFGNWTADNEYHTHICGICDVSESDTHLFSEYDIYNNKEHDGICETCGYKKRSAHNFSDWKVSDEKSHVRVCSDCGYTENVKHEYGDWISYGDGSHSRKCTDCGYTESGDHNFSKWEYSDKDKHERVCSDCGYIETIKHEYGNWVSYVDGSHSRRCTDCGHTENGDHNFSKWTYSNKTIHERVCSDCGYTEIIKHKYSDWTSSTDDIHTKKCTECGYIIEAEHNFTEFSASDAENHIKICNDCGHTEILPHSFGEMSVTDENYHSETCEECGYVHVCKHDFSDWQNNGNAEQIRICNDCAYSEVEKIDYISGDIDGDGKTDSFDLVLARQKLNRDFENSVEFAAADVNRDGIFDKADIILLQDFILGKTETLK